MRALQSREQVCPCPSAIKAWNLMGGVIDYAALPTIIDMVGAQNPERLINQLAVLRDYQRSKEQN